MGVYVCFDDDKGVWVIEVDGGRRRVEVDDLIWDCVAEVLGIFSLKDVENFYLDIAKVGLSEVVVESCWHV